MWNEKFIYNLMSIGISSSKPYRFHLWIVLIVFFMSANLLQAATYYSRASGNFTANTVWSLTRGGATVNYPGTAHTYIIQTGHTITLSANQTAVAVTIESGGILTPNNTRTLTAPLTIDAGGTLNVNTRAYTQSGTLVNNGTITGTTGRVQMNGNALTNAGSITLTTGRLTRTTGSIINSGSITMGAGQFTATTGIFTNEATGTLTITGTATVTMGTGDFTNNNTSSSVNFGSSAVSIGGTANQSIGGFVTTGRFTTTNTAGTKTLTGNITVGGITRNGTGGTLNMGVGLTHTTTNTVILTAGTMNGGSSTINVNIVSTSAWSGTTATVFVPGTSTVNFGAAGAQTLSATGTKTFYNLTFSNSGVKTNGTTTVNNIFSLEGTATASEAPTYGASATLRYNTATARNAGLEWITPFAATGGVVIANTGAINPNGNKVFNLNIPLTINSGATLSPAAGNTFTFGGDLINDGTWTASSGAVTINQAGVSQSIGRFSTSGLVTMSKTSGTATFAGNINGGAFTMNGAGILNLGTGLTHTFTGAWTNTAGTLQGNTSTLNIGGTGSGTGVTFTAGTSTVNFNGAGAQDIPAFNYYNLTTSTGSTKTLLGNTTVSNVLTVNLSTTLAASTFTLNLSGTGTPFVNSGTFTAGTSTVNFNGSGAQNIPGLNYYNLTTSTGNTKTLQGTITVSNVLTIGASTTLASGANTINLSLTGTPMVVSGTFTAGTGTVNFNSAGAQNIPAQTYYNLTTSTGGIKTLQGSTTVSNVLTINASTTLAASTFTLNLSGTGTPFVNSGTFTAGTSTVNFNGSGAQNITDLTYYNLNTATGNSKTLQGNTTVNNVLTIGAGTTLLPGANTINLTFTGTPLVVSGIFTAETSTVNFNGSGAQNIPALNYYNLSTSTGNTKTLQGTTTVSNILTINASTILAAGAHTLNLSRDGTPLIIGGTFTAGTSTVNFNGTGVQNIPALTYYNLITSNGATKSLLGTTTVSNVLTINGSTTLDLADFILNLSGAGTPLINNGTFNCGTSSVNFTSASSTNIPALNYYDLNLTGGARVLANTGIIGIAGEFITGGGGFTVTGSTVDFNGDLDQTIPSFTFFSLLITGGGSKLIDSVVNANEITIEDGAIVNLFSDGTGILNITNE